MISEIFDRFPDEVFTVADGFDDAIIGVDTQTMRLVYSVKKCINILSESMSLEEAEEYFDFNVRGSYV